MCTRMASSDYKHEVYRLKTDREDSVQIVRYGEENRRNHSQPNGLQVKTMMRLSDDLSGTMKPILPIGYFRFLSRLLICDNIDQAMKKAFDRITVFTTISEHFLFLRESSNPTRIPFDDQICIRNQAFRSVILCAYGFKHS